MPPGTVSGQRLPSSALEMYRSTGTGAAVVVAASVAPSSDPPQAAASGRSSRETATRAERARTDGILHPAPDAAARRPVHRRFAGAAQAAVADRRGGVHADDLARARVPVGYLDPAGQSETATVTLAGGPPQ